MFKKIRNIAGIIIAISLVIGLLFSLDAYVAKAKDVEQLSIRLDQKIIQDRIDFLQAQIWKKEDRHGYDITKMSKEVKDTYRRLKVELEKSKGELEKLRVE